MSKVAIYVASFVTFVAVIAVGYQHPNTSAETGDSLSITEVNVSDTTRAPSVDSIIATDVAAEITERANLPIAPTVANAAVSLNVQNQLAQADDGSVIKPQIIAPAATSREIIKYKAKRGDTVEKLAKKFNISEDTIRWVNDLESDALEPGKKLTILPVDGITYTFKSGDSIKSIAKTYNTEAARIVSFNDLELSKPKAGQKLIIPSGVLPQNQQPGYTAPVATPTYIIGYSSGFGGDTWHIKTGTPMYNGNKYAPGNCTAYAYDRRHELGMPVGGNWGNASTWTYFAAIAGYRVDHTPSVGAVIQNTGGAGHVGIVEKVLPNGDIEISEMNAYVPGGGFNQVSGRKIPKSSVGQYAYIH